MKLRLCYMGVRYAGLGCIHIIHRIETLYSLFVFYIFIKNIQKTTNVLKKFRTTNEQKIKTKQLSHVIYNYC